MTTEVQSPRRTRAQADAARLADLPPDEEAQTMILNMGPQHPSTHGVLRLMLELEGERVLRTKPVIGYLHTGMEKTASRRAMACFDPVTSLKTDFISS